MSIQPTGGARVSRDRSESWLAVASLLVPPLLMIAFCRIEDHLAFHGRGWIAAVGVVFVVVLGLSLRHLACRLKTQRGGASLGAALLVASGPFWGPLTGVPVHFHGSWCLVLLLFYALSTWIFGLYLLARAGARHLARRGEHPTRRRANEG